MCLPSAIFESLPRAPQEGFPLTVWSSSRPPNTYRHFPVVNPIRTASSIILPVLEFHNRRQIKPQSLFSRALQFLHHILPGNYPQLNSCSSLCFLCLTRDQFFSFALLLAAFGLAHNKKLPTLRTSRQKKKRTERDFETVSSVDVPFTSLSQWQQN